MQAKLWRPIARKRAFTDPDSDYASLSKKSSLRRFLQAVPQLTLRILGLCNDAWSKFFDDANLRSSYRVKSMLVPTGVEPFSRAWPLPWLA